MLRYNELVKSRLLVLCFVGVSSFAHASFELALLTTVGSNAIMRVDPENRILLGSFGANRLIAPRAIAARTTDSEAYILNSYGFGGSRITVMNYFTGATIREFSVNAGPSVFDLELLSNGEVFVTNGSSILRYSATGALIQTIAGSEAYTSVSYSEFFNEVYGHSATGTRYFSGDTGTSFGFVAGSNMSGANASQGSRVTMGGDGQNLRRFNHLTLSYLSTTFTGMNSINAVGYGHGTTAYAAGFGTAGQSTITTFDTTKLNRLSDAWNITGGGNGITGIAVVTAPEPGTFLALGAGLAAILRRRKRK